MPKVRITLTDAQRKQVADERVAARRASRRILQQRIVRSSEGWRIEEEQMGRKRRSPQEWSTRAEAQAALDGGYRVPELIKPRSIRVKPVITDIVEYGRRSPGPNCVWCAKQEETVRARFSVHIKFDMHKTVCLPLCHPNTHDLSIGERLNHNFEKEETSE